jgi:hypothetical protein
MAEPHIVPTTLIKIIRRRGCLIAQAGLLYVALGDVYNTGVAHHADIDRMVELAETDRRPRPSMSRGATMALMSSSARAPAPSWLGPLFRRHRTVRVPRPQVSL